MSREEDRRTRHLNDEDLRLSQSCEADLGVIQRLKAKVWRVAMAEAALSTASQSESSGTAAARQEPSSTAPDTDSSSAASDDETPSTSTRVIPKTTALDSKELKLLGKKARKVSRILNKQRQLVQEARAQLQKDIENKQGTEEQWEEREIELGFREEHIKGEMGNIWQMPNEFLQSDIVHRMIREWGKGSEALFIAFKTGEAPPMDDMTTEGGDDLPQ